MDDVTFVTGAGDPVPAVTADEMREVDRVAVDEVGIPLGWLMENAGRNLAREVHELTDGPVTILAGGGGNGGGGLCCGRHLANHGVDVRVVLDRDPDDLDGVVARQWRVTRAADVTASANPASALDDAVLVVDAVLGYGLRGTPRGRAAVLIGACESFPGQVLSLDVPSGVDATTGETPGSAVEPDRTLTLALPKTGLADASGDLVLGDIGIPAGAFERAGVEYTSPFRGRYRTWLEVRRPSG